MFQKLIQFQQITHNPNLSVPKFIMYDLTNNGPAVAWVNIKYDVDIVFTWKKIKEFLMNFLELDNNNYSNFIKKEVNQKGIEVNHHGAIQDENIITRIAKRKPENLKFTDNNTVTYILSEIGININDTFDPNKYQPLSMITYDTDNRELEIKFFKIHDPNTRVVVNVHFIHDDQKNDTQAAVKELDNLISKINDNPEVKKQITIATNVSIYDFTRHGYSIANTSIPYYIEVSELYMCAKENILLYPEIINKKAEKFTALSKLGFNNENPLNSSEESDNGWGKREDFSNNMPSSTSHAGLLGSTTSSSPNTTTDQAAKRDNAVKSGVFHTDIPANKETTTTSQNNSISPAAKCYWYIATKNKNFSLDLADASKHWGYVSSVINKCPPLFDDFNRAEKSLNDEMASSSAVYKSFIFELAGSKEKWTQIFSDQNTKQIVENITSIHIREKADAKLNQIYLKQQGEAGEAPTPPSNKNN